MRRSPSAPAEALARAEVAEAIALERSGDREALAAHLAEKRALLLDSTAPRERAVVRAYQRMLRAPKSSVYRRSASRDAPAAAATDGEPTVADWIARVAPAAAPFARAARAPSPDGAAPASAEDIEPGLVRVAEARLEGNAGPYPSASRARVAAAWVLLVLFACLLWMLFYEPGDAVELLAFVPRSAGALLGWTVALLAGSAALRVARNARYDWRLAVAVSAVGRGDAGAVAEIEAVARVTSVPAAPQALLQLARLAVRRADFDEALRRCDQGIAVVTARGSAGALAASMLLPDLVAERAFVLAATDRHAKAAAEMAVLVKTFPAYPFLARAELRVGLVSRARRGYLAGAARLVAGDTDDLPLSLRDETLADLVRATAHPETIRRRRGAAAHGRAPVRRRPAGLAEGGGAGAAPRVRGAGSVWARSPGPRCPARRGGGARGARGGGGAGRGTRGASVAAAMRCGALRSFARRGLRRTRIPRRRIASLASLRHARGGDLPGGLPLPVAARRDCRRPLAPRAARPVGDGARPPARRGARSPESVLALARLMRLGDSRPLVSRPLWVLGGLGVVLGRRRRGRPWPAWPAALGWRAIARAGGAAAVAVALSMVVSRPCLNVDRRWHIPLAAVAARPDAALPTTCTTPGACSRTTTRATSSPPSCRRSPAPCCTRRSRSRSPTTSSSA